MIDFYSDGTTVGVAFSGWTAIIFLVILIWDIISLCSSSTFLFHKVFLYFRVKPFDVYVRVNSKLRPGSWTNDIVKVDWFGNIVSTDIISNISNNDTFIDDGEKNQFNRDKILDSLGI